MKIISRMGSRRSALAALVVSAGFGHAAEGPLEGEWGGLDARGATAQVMVTSDNILGFFWGGGKPGRRAFTMAAGGSNSLSRLARRVWSRHPLARV